MPISLRPAANALAAVILSLPLQAIAQDAPPEPQLALDSNPFSAVDIQDGLSLSAKARPPGLDLGHIRLRTTTRTRTNRNPPPAHGPSVELAVAPPLPPVRVMAAVGGTSPNMSDSGGYLVAEVAPSEPSEARVIVSKALPLPDGDKLSHAARRAAIGAIYDLPGLSGLSLGSVIGISGSTLARMGHELESIAALDLRF